MNGTPILLAEDDDITREMLSAALSLWGYSVVEVNNGREALRVLQSESRPQLAILDWIMPELEGPEVCREVRAGASSDYTYLILLTQRNQREARLLGLEAGADDFVTKPFDPDELRLRLRTGARVIDLQEQLLGARNALQQRLDRDHLTGIASREAVLESLKREKSRALRTKAAYTVMMIDIDDFKKLNDQYGYQAGDSVLRHTADIIQNVLRPYDVCGRFGPDEFLLILPNTYPMQEMQIAERLAQSVIDHPKHFGDTCLNVTISAGFASVAAGTDADSARVIAAADEALHQARQGGHNKIWGTQLYDGGQFRPVSGSSEFETSEPGSPTTTG